MFHLIDRNAYGGVHVRRFPHRFKMILGQFQIMCVFALILRNLMPVISGTATHLTAGKADAPDDRTRASHKTSTYAVHCKSTLEWKLPKQ
jgi:hypothetical protein